MPLRVGFDMDGVLADFATAYHEAEARLFGRSAHTTRAGNPEEETAEEAPSNNRSLEGDAKTDAPSFEGNRGAEAGARRVEDVRGVEGERASVEEKARKNDARPSELRRRRDVVWQAIQDTPDFWTTLKPLDPTAVRRIHNMMVRHRWEVFFITQRPATDGDTVQRQTQRWLVEQGFDLPSVLVIAGSRGAAAGALHLDYHVDDSAKNCIDVKAESGAKPLLIVDPTDNTTVISARRLGIGTAHTIDECLQILEEASLNRTQPTLLNRLAKLVGWQ
jgi:phosphoglycolate phosphatase-like HAD superfamily hydrolase